MPNLYISKFFVLQWTIEANVLIEKLKENTFCLFSKQGKYFAVKTQGFEQKWQMQIFSKNFSPFRAEWERKILLIEVATNTLLSISWDTQTLSENALKLTVCKETIQKTKVTISANKLLEMKLRLNIVWYLVGRLGTQYSISRT